MIQFIFQLMGGTALLLYGVDLLGDGLEHMSGKMMKKVLERFTGRLWKAFLSGIFLTAAVQSSTAISVLSVGFVNSGIMQLSQAIGIIYGANIGTTITAQFMALSASFNLIRLSLPLLAVGYLVSIAGKSASVKNTGRAMLGAGFILLGLLTLNQGIPYMVSSPAIRYFFAHYASHALLGILIGMISTALVHSSAATVGIVILLGSGGLITLRTAVILMLGDNIGTSVTALLASLNGNTNARRTAWGHALHNIIGVLIALPFLTPFVMLVEAFTLNLQGSADIKLQIANSHTLFNIIMALIFLPMNRHFVRLLMFLVRDSEKKEKKAGRYIDRLLLDTPVAALDASVRELSGALSSCGEMLSEIFQSMEKNTDEHLEKAEAGEKNMTALQRELTRYMTDLFTRNLTNDQSTALPGVIKGAKYLERLASHTSHLMSLQAQRKEKDMFFTEDAMEELKILKTHLFTMTELALSGLAGADEPDLSLLRKMDGDLSEKVATFSDTHVVRLENGRCTLDASLFYLEILQTTERIGNYLYKIGKLGFCDLRGKRPPGA